MFVKRVRAIATVVVSTIALVVAAPLSYGATTVSMQASSFRFCPDGSQPCNPAGGTDTRTVQVGDTVKWTYRDTACDVVAPCPGHNVVFADGVQGATMKSQGAVLLTRTFTAPGTYNYQCTIHAGNGMLGVVVVQGTAQGAVTTTTATSTTTRPTVAGRSSLPATGAPAHLAALTALGSLLIAAGLSVLSLRPRTPR